MNRRTQFNKGALYALPMFLLLFLWLFYYGDRVPEFSPWVLGAVAVALLLLIIALLIFLAGRRTKALRRVAGELGLEFSPEGNESSLETIFNPANPEAEKRAFEEAIRALGPPPEPQVMTMLAASFARVQAQRGLQQSELRRLTLFKDVEHPKASNVLAGQRGGGEVLVFDYSYHTPRRPTSSSASYSVEQTVAAFRFRGRAFPAFEVSRRGMIAKIAAIAGAHGITFDSHPKFSKHFQLRGDDETAVRMLFTPAAREFFERLGDDFDQTIEGANECIVVYRGNHVVKPGEMNAFVSKATEVASVFGV
jgi:hypothetical protein